MKDVIKKEKHYNHPITEVWNAISKAEQISAWFIKADFKAEKGYHYTFVHEDTTINGTVVKVNPVTELVYTWIVGGTGIETTVSWKLEEKTSGTLLTLEHSGISNYPSEEMSATMFTNFSGGWVACIESLENHLKNSAHA